MVGDDKDQVSEKSVVMDTPERTQIPNPLSKFEVNLGFIFLLFLLVESFGF